MTKQLLSPEWVTRLEQFDTLIVGFSGGLDSTVLLYALASHATLQNKLQAVYINHGLSANAQAWQAHCDAFCLQRGIPFSAHSVHFDRSANIEEEARIARYAVFSSLLTGRDCLLLGHHLNDQAETVLLQLFRGAGIDGLSAMQDFGNLGAGGLARPLLTTSREQLEQYAAQHELVWIEDESNQNSHYARNYLRQEVMPLLSNKWPGVAGNLARTAAHCQQARSNLDALAKLDCKELSNSLAIEPLKLLSVERITNVLRVWLRHNQVQLPSGATLQRLIHEVILASPDAMPLVSWDKVQVRRYQGYLYVDQEEVGTLPSCIEWRDFPQSLVVTDTLSLTALASTKGLVIPAAAKLTVRFREGGELFVLHGQTKQLKKLLQEWQVLPWRREQIPLLYINEQLAAVVGYAVSDLFYGEDSVGVWEINTLILI